MGENGKGYLIGVVLLVVGLVGGLGIGKAMNNSDSSSSHSHAMTTASKADDLRASLVTLGVQHMELTDAAVADALDGSPGADATAKALYDNGTTIGTAVGSVYGKDAETTFNSVWKLHLDQFV